MSHRKISTEAVYIARSTQVVFDIFLARSVVKVPKLSRSQVIILKGRSCLLIN